MSGTWVGVGHDRGSGRGTGRNRSQSPWSRTNLGTVFWVGVGVWGRDRCLGWGTGRGFRSEFGTVLELGS